MLFETPSSLPEERDVVEHIDVLRKRLSYATATPNIWTGMLRRDAFARAIRGSNTIEGYNVTMEDAVAAAEDEEPMDADQETWRAITGYRDALTYILQLSNDPHFEYDESLIRSLHYMLLKHDLAKHPGQWRPGPVRVVDERKNKTVYTGPDAEFVPPLMRELIAALNAEDGVPAMVKASMAHLNLTMIHPFSDGNGRMARALQTLILAREGILNPAFCSIEEYLGRHQIEYYQVLAAVGSGSWHPERDARPWVRFCLTAHYQCATALLRRSREIQLIWDRVEDLRRELKLPERVETALVAVAFGRRIRNSFYRKMAEVSDQIASRDLKKLTDVGLLIPQGERRGRVYVGSKKLKDIRASIREPRVEGDPFLLPAIDEPELPGLRTN